MDDSIFAEIKKRLNLAEIIGEDFPVKGRGHEYRGARDDCNSLVITRSRTTGEWYYYWNSKNEGGDVFNWLKNHRGMDMKTALEYAAKRAKVSLPEWTRKETRAWVAAKAAEDLMTVATRVFEKWLHSSSAAFDYCRNRGWTDDTIMKARLGFSGFATAAEFKEMKAELMMNNIDPDSPAAVAILGFKGDVEAWSKQWEMEKAVSNDDINNGYLPGFMGRPRLIFPHLYFNQVQYLSSRNLQKTKDGELISYGGKNKSFNPRREFLGERKPYFGHNYKSSSSHVVIVEGQPDVITLAQWGVNVFGLCGTSLDGYWGKELSERHASRYFATDSDSAGQNAVKGRNGDWPIVELLGPLTQVVQWPTAAREKAGIKALKDANDLLQSYQWRGTPHDVQVKAVWTRLNASETVAVLAARDAAQVQKSKIKSQEQKNATMIRAFEIIAKLDRKTTDLMLKQFTKALEMRVQEFNRNLKIARGERDSQDDSTTHTIKETFGGWYPIDEEGKKGWLVDYLYDRVKGKAMLAYRDPNGQIGKAQYLDINGARYFPKIDDNVRIGLVQFPSDLGPEKSTKELVAMKELYFRNSFLLDNPLNYKIMAFWAQESWLYDSFDECSFLKAEGDANSGKSAIMVRAGHVCYRFTRTSGVGTAASIKYMKHLYRGVIFLDEVPDNLDEFDERVTMFNIAAMKEQAWITNAMPTKMPDGTVVPEVQSYYVYGPIMATMYGKFPQKATESRFIVIKTFEKTLAELRKHKIPRRFTDEMRARALAIRNMDITWRLRNWQPRIQPPDELEDLNVSTRVNQVTVPIKYLVRDDPKALEEVGLVVRNLYREQQEEQQTGKEARVLDAIVAVLEEQKFINLGLVKESELKEFGIAKYIAYSDLAKVANLIMDEMNTGEEADVSALVGSDDDDDDDDVYPGKNKNQKRKYKMTPQTVGFICRKDFRLPRHRMGRGFVAILESSVQPEAAQERIQMLKVKYGLAEFGEAAPSTLQDTPEPDPNMDVPSVPEPEYPPDYEQGGLL